MAKRKIKLFRALDNDIVLRIYAVSLAVVIWFILSITLYPTIYKTVNNVPITLSVEGSYAEGNSLNPIGFEEQTLNVQLKGMRYEIGNLSKDDLEARIIVNEVRAEGEYELPIEIVSKNNAQFSVESMSVTTVKVKFDKIATKTFELNVESPDYTAATGFTKDTPTVNIDEITITGPQTQLENITKCVVRVIGEAELTESLITSNTELILYSESTIVDKEPFKFSKSDFIVEIPIYMKKDLNLTFDIRNAPANFNKDSLKYEMSVESIQIAAPNGTIDDIDDIHLGYIDLADIRSGAVFERDIVLGENYRNLSNIDKVTITFNDDNLTSKYFTLDKSKIHIINAPSKYSVTALTESIQKVMIIGPKEIISKISVNDIVAEIDLLNNNETGSFSREVRIYSPKYNNVWCYGSYYISLDINTKSANIN